VMTCRPNRFTLLRGPDGLRAWSRYERELRSGRLGPPATAGDRLTGHLARAGVTEIGLLRAASRIGEIDPHDGAFSLVDFLAAIVADEPRYTCQRFSSQIDAFPRLA
jgi:hypothetical protein